MKKIIFVYGAIAGLIVIGTMISGFVFADGESVLTSEWLGYLVMLVALSLIFVGIKRYRDTELGGVIRFGQAFLLGLGIAAVAGVAYVVAWEIYLASSDYAFIDQYTANFIEGLKAGGMTGEALAAEIAKMEDLRAQYSNPWFRIPMTFTEIFPVGLLIALISAAILRNPGVLPAQNQQ